MQLIDLTFKGARHHSLAQSLDAVHLGLHHASPVVTTPTLAIHRQDFENAHRWDFDVKDPESNQMATRWGLLAG